MPQVDLEALVSVCGGGGSDRKIACETLADGGHHEEPEEPDVPPEAVDEVPPDFPPESFWLSKDAEFDWFDRNAFYERKESTKGNSNPNSNSNSNPLSSHSNSSSQRFSSNLKSKASIIGLPKKQNTNYVDVNRRIYKPAKVRLFPKRYESAGKSAIPVSEPSSPKVSCMGRVRSNKGRRSRRHSEQQKACCKKMDKGSTGGGDKRKLGFFEHFVSLFISGGRRREKPAAEKKVQPVKSESPPRKSVTVKLNSKAELAAEAPGLGGMKRFASGRRSESWGSEDFDVSKCDLMELERRVSTVLDGPTGSS